MDEQTTGVDALQVIAGAIHDARYGDNGDHNTRRDVWAEAVGVAAALTDAGLLVASPAEPQRSPVVDPPWVEEARREVDARLVELAIAERLAASPDAEPESKAEADSTEHPEPKCALFGGRPVCFEAEEFYCRVHCYHEQPAGCAGGTT